MLYQKDEILLANDSLDYEKAPTSASTLQRISLSDPGDKKRGIQEDRNIFSDNDNDINENNKVVINNDLDLSINRENHSVNNVMNNLDMKKKGVTSNDKNHRNNKNQKDVKAEVKQSFSTITTNIKNQSLSLRVSKQQICTVIDAHPPRCTHFDALRFFTGPALPLNRILPTPTRILQMSSDQPGCLHVNMDLFKWAVNMYPFISSELIADTLALALQVPMNVYIYTYIYIYVYMCIYIYIYIVYIQYIV
jgi:hypothetical protein